MVPHRAAVSDMVRRPRHNGRGCWGRVLNRAGKHLLCLPHDAAEHDRCETPRICLTPYGNEGETVIALLRSGGTVLLSFPVF
jgi:hypothetical protein